jgi:NADPH:quinone reductase-like Zn-dependent oxidoreductase
MGILGGGGHAEKVRVHERMCLRMPPLLSFEEAGAIPEAFLTAYDALLLRGRLAPGEAVVLTAAGSGVGTAAAAIALACGARVIATSRSPEKRRRLEQLGIHAVFDPADDGLAGQLRLAAGGEGVDLAIDFVGAASWGAILEALAPKGRIVLVGTLSGAKVEADLGLIMRKRLTVSGTVLRSRPLEEKIALTQSFARSILPMIAAGRLRAIVDRVLPLAEAASAHAAMERNETFGKIVLTM